MATYRNISLEFWSDRKIQDEFELYDKYIYLYLLTNPATTISGCYEVSKLQMELDTKMKWNQIEKTLYRLDALDVIKYSKEYHEVLVVNWGRYNWSKSPQVKRAVIYTMDKIKNPEFRKFVEQAVACKFDNADAPVTPESEQKENELIPNEKKSNKESKKALIDFGGMIVDMEFSDCLTNAVGDWVEYKRERKDLYNSKRGFQTVLNKIKTEADKYGDTAVCDLIYLCIERNWKGIIWEQIKKENNKPASTDNNRLGWMDSW